MNHLAMDNSTQRESISVSKKHRIKQKKLYDIGGEKEPIFMSGILYGVNAEPQRW